MMGERRAAQEALFYEFSLDRHVPADHLLRVDLHHEFGMAYVDRRIGDRDVIGICHAGGRHEHRAQEHAKTIIQVGGTFVLAIGGIGDSQRPGGKAEIGHTLACRDGPVDVAQAKICSTKRRIVATMDGITIDGRLNVDQCLARATQEEQELAEPNGDLAVVRRQPASL